METYLIYRLPALFRRIALLLEIQGADGFKINAYRRAAERLANTEPETIRYLWEQGRLTDLPDIGTAIAKKIDEFLRTGHLDFLTRLEQEVPPGLVDLTRLPGLGPKRVRRLWLELGITDLDTLEQAAAQGRVQALRGFSTRTEVQILQAIRAQREHEERLLLGEALPAAEALLHRLREHLAVVRAEPTGSLRRGAETVGDVDLLIATTTPDAVLRLLEDLPTWETLTSSAAEVQARWQGLPVHILFCPPDTFAAQWLYATGSAAHREALAQRGAERGLTLTPQGWRDAQGVLLPAATEADLYARVDLPFIPPELRQGQGEIEAAAQGRLPTLLRSEDLLADLHSHSTWSDGRFSIREMALAALERGLRVLAITDHSQSLTVAGGLTPEDLRRQRAEIAQVQAELGDRLLLLQGAEVEIAPDGTLDYPDEVLAELDIVIASLHTHLRQPAQEITQRLLRAIAHPHVDIIGHPTGRLLPHRPPADLDMERIFAAAAAHGVALEINANPHRLDLHAAHIRRALEHGVVLSLNTDAHRPAHFAYRRYGVLTARRGWATAEAVLNTWTPERLLTWLRTPKPQRARQKPTT